MPHSETKFRFGVIFPSDPGVPRDEAFLRQLKRQSFNSPRELQAYVEKNQYWLGPWKERLASKDYIANVNRVPDTTIGQVTTEVVKS